MLKTELMHEITSMNPKNCQGAISPSAEGTVGAAESAAVPARIVRQRKTAESRQHNQRLRLLIESVDDYGIFMLDSVGRISSWNPGAKRMKGYSAEEILGQHFSIFYTSEQQRAHKPDDELKIASQMGRFAEEGWRVRKDGSHFWAGVVISVMRDTRGTLIGYAKVTRDLTERRQAEQQLAEANLLNQAILQGAPYAIIACTPDGIVRSFNPAAVHMLGYSADELIGNASTTLLHDPSEVVARAAELQMELGRPVEFEFEVIAHDARLGITEERDWTYVRKDKSRIPVHLTVSALRDLNDAVSGYLNIAYDITERKRRADDAAHKAQHDFLTGLPNRLLLRDRLAMTIERAQRSERKAAVLMLDLDHFKRVNDSFGHDVGDALLKVVAGRIKERVRGVDTVSRFGGDEFVVVLDQIKDTADAERVAGDILEGIAAPLVIDTHEFIIASSIGISCYPEDGDDAAVLLKSADTAMYRAKDLGRGTYCTFNREMAKLVTRRGDIEAAMHRAFAGDKFRLHYQPQVHLASGEVFGIEALLRWEDPVLGHIPPDQFIPVAEESGLIVPLGEWVLRTACRDARDLQRNSGHALRLAINLSPRQFLAASLIPRIRAALDDSGFPADCLEIEITEGTLMSFAEMTIARLREIRALGVTVAIDDFGVGFSSLSYITRLPIDTLKLDRSFVSKLPESVNDAAVAQAIIALATSLDLRLIAEGVETQEQLDFLRIRNCEAAQGYFLGRPVSASEFASQRGPPSEALSVG
jgi:diguanylate cyclase (GGDEF)-like protein/PAS domain S-box-containing protein